MTPPASERPTATLQIDRVKLTGAAAILTQLAIVALVVGLVVWLHPHWAWSWMWVSAALWIAFQVVWSVAAAGASAARRRESDPSRALHELLLMSSLVLLFLHVPGLRGRWLPTGAWPVAVGLALHAASFALAVWARRILGKHWSGAITEKVGHELVGTGPYRLIRHPIYTAMFGMTIGTALVSGEWHALVAVGLLVIAYARKIALEERHLARVFGDAWTEYRRTRRALVPWVL
jgi:protein-S-isoprenylcysteine O-methyltransferase Ste14